MTFYCGIDLHAKKSHVCVIDKDGKKVKEKNLNNDLSLIFQFLRPFGKDVHIAIESTINWYWIVDGLQEAGYDVKLAPTLGLHMITGDKVKTDRRDAFKLAKLSWTELSHFIFLIKYHNLWNIISLTIIKPVNFGINISSCTTVKNCVSPRIFFTFFNKIKFNFSLYLFQYCLDFFI